jgi:MFS family permease
LRSGFALTWKRPQFRTPANAVAPPQAASFASTLKAIITGIGRLMVWSAAGYTYLVIMPTYLQSALHTGFNQALLIAVISNAGFALTIIPSGMLSDRIGRRAVMVTAAVLLLILALPLLKICRRNPAAYW